MRTVFALLASSVPPLRRSLRRRCPCEETRRKAAAKPVVWKDAPGDSFSPRPTLADVHYGPHPEAGVAFLEGGVEKPTPLLFFIHGGGWTGGNRASGLVGLLPEMLKAGISVVSIEYRFVQEAQAAGVKPPVEWPLHDAARALQFVRSKAAEWNIDKQRIGASGGSAGACSSLWLAFHPDMADPKSSDPVARESTRLWCAAVTGGADHARPAADEGVDAQQPLRRPRLRSSRQINGKKLSQFDEFLAGRDKILPWIAEYSPYALVTADDPPVYLTYGTPPAMGQEQKDPTHTSNFGVKLQEKCKSVGVECELVYPGAPDVKHPTVQSYLIDKLKAAKR